MTMKDLVRTTRTRRRFDQSAAISRETLLDFVDHARLCGCGSNRQSLKYRLVCEAAVNELVFPCLAWAGHLKDWQGPAEGERPTAYIVILGDTTIAEPNQVDHGIAAQTILLAATEKGLGGCMIGSVQRDRLRGVLNIASHLTILLVLALGVPVENVVLETMAPGDDFKYWRDENGVHHVPKRMLEEVVVG